MRRPLATLSVSGGGYPTWEIGGPGILGGAPDHDVLQATLRFWANHYNKQRPDRRPRCHHFQLHPGAFWQWQDFAEKLSESTLSCTDSGPGKKRLYDGSSVTNIIQGH